MHIRPVGRIALRVINKSSSLKKHGSGREMGSPINERLTDPPGSSDLAMALNSCGWLALDSYLGAGSCNDINNDL